MATFPSRREISIDALLDSEFPTRRTDSNIFLNARGTLRPDQTEARNRYLAGQKRRQELALLSDDELRHRYEALEASIEADQWFHKPTADADISFWARASYWTLDEAVALSFKKDPRRVKLDRLKSLTRSPFAGEYLERIDLVMRAKTMGQLWEQTIPMMFLAWAARTMFPMPSELTAAVTALGIQIADWKSLYETKSAAFDDLRAKLSAERDKYLASLKERNALFEKIRTDHQIIYSQQEILLKEKDKTIDMLSKANMDFSAQLAAIETKKSSSAERILGVRERESLLKLAIGMAIKGYGYVPTSPRNTTAKEIASDLSLVGLTIDEDTVRKYLSEAKELLPGDETEQKR